MALQYSTARMSLGRRRISPDSPICARASARAAGKDLPPSSSRRSRGEKSSESSARAVSIRSSASPVSAPKQRVSHSLDRMPTPPAANPSAEDRLTVVGSSTTRSAPQATAAFAGGFIHDGGRAPLDVIAAHGAHNGGFPAKLRLDPVELLAVACMKGVIFGNDTNGFQNSPSFF